jgi:hypothetical protein
LRLAAGICVLSTGLLVGSAGGAIAAADTDTGGSAPQSQGVDGAAGSAASEPASSSVTQPMVSTATPKPGSLLMKTVTNTLALLGKLGQQQAATTKRLLTVPEGVPTDKETKGSDLGGEAGTPLAADTTEVAPAETGLAPNANATATSVMDPMAPVIVVVKPVANAVATVMGVAGTVPGMILALPTSKTPVVDVITSVQQMLTSVTDAVLPLASVPNDLYTMFAATSVVPVTSTVGRGASFGVRPVTAADAPLISSVMPAWPLIAPSSEFWDGRGDVAALATAGGVATVGLAEQLLVSGTAPLATQVATPKGVLPVLQHAVRALLVPASLSALAALALPGVGGLLIVCAAGIRIGYRQAKAGWMLRVSGIARFAGSGPLGVVRTGSLIALRPRAVRSVRPVASRAVAFLDQAA